MAHKIRTWGRDIWDKKQEEQGSLGVIAGTVETKNIFDRQTVAEFKIIEREIISLLKPKAKVVDAGVGPFARFSVEFAKRGFSVTGIDVSPKVLYTAGKRVKNSGYKVNLLEEDMTKIRNVDKGQDLVFCFGTFGHIPSFLALKVLGEFNKILKKGGYAYIHFWIKSDSTKRILHDFVYDLGHHIKATFGRGYKVNSSFYSKEEIAEMAKLSGFEIVKVIEDKYLFRKV